MSHNKLKIPNMRAVGSGLPLSTQERESRTLFAAEHFDAVWYYA